MSAAIDKKALVIERGRSKGALLIFDQHTRGSDSGVVLQWAR